MIGEMWISCTRARPCSQNRPRSTRPAGCPRRCSTAMQSLQSTGFLSIGTEAIVTTGPGARRGSPPTPVRRLGGVIHSGKADSGNAGAACESQIVAARFPRRNVSELAKELERRRVLVSAQHGYICRVSPHFSRQPEEDIQALDGRAKNAAGHVTPGLFGFRQTLVDRFDKVAGGAAAGLGAIAVVVVKREARAH